MPLSSIITEIKHKLKDSLEDVGKNGGLVETLNVLGSKTHKYSPRNP